MIRRTPLRRISLHRSQIRFTEARTFMLTHSSHPGKNRPEIGKRSPIPGDLFLYQPPPPCHKHASSVAKHEKGRPDPWGVGTPVDSIVRKHRSRPMWTRGAKNILIGSL